MAGVCKGAISATEAYFMDDTSVHCNLRDLRKAWRVCNTNCMPICHVICSLGTRFCFPLNSMASFPRVYHGPVASPAILGAT